MFKKIALCSMLAFAVQSAFAQSADPAAAAKLADSLHLSARIDAVRAQTAAMGERQVEQMLAQLEKNTKMSPKQSAALRVSAAKFMTSVTNAWSSEEASRIFTSNLTATMPAAATERALAFYATPEGQQSLVAVSSAEQQMTAYITGTAEKATTANYAIFIEDMKRIMAAKPN